MVDLQGSQTERTTIQSQVSRLKKNGKVIEIVINLSDQDLSGARSSELESEFSKSMIFAHQSFSRKLDSRTLISRSTSRYELIFGLEVDGMCYSVFLFKVMSSVLRTRLSQLVLIFAFGSKSWFKSKLL